MHWIFNVRWRPSSLPLLYGQYIMSSGREEGADRNIYRAMRYGPELIERYLRPNSLARSKAM